MVLPCIRFRLRRNFCSGKHCTGDATLCAASWNDDVLAFSIGPPVVTPIRIRGRCVCAFNNGRSATINWCFAQIDGEKSEQSDSAPALQHVLLFASESIGTRTRSGTGDLAITT